MDNVSSAEILRIRKLMDGSSFDKDQAEDRLKQCDPCTLPGDILEPWLAGSTYDKFRAGRVKEVWTNHI